MATLGSSQQRASASPNRRRSFARRCERGCCTCVTYLPLTFVYGLTTWAVWVQSSLGWREASGTWIAALGIILYLLTNWCYTTAVFTDPGSPINTTATANPYTALPDQESHALSHGTTLTVKASGEMRFCKKCQTRKPDRAHHCSTCRRCVLKMDHHCPWLATCVGLRNYKPFILFLFYVCLFCYVCFYASVSWVTAELFNQAAFEDQLMPVHYILLAVLSGIIGLVLSGFTGWHLYLSITGQTTIESLEKTRYLTPIRKSMQQQIQQQSRHPHAEGPSFQNLGDQLREIHANALPGVTRPEEGEDDRTSSPAQTSLRRSYRDIERQREIDRYNDYLDETESEKLPNAFDLGTKRNIEHVFGENKLLWLLPICNTTGDGWRWEASQKWIEARDSLAKKREAQRREQDMFQADERGWVDRVDFRAASPSPYRGSPNRNNGMSRGGPLPPPPPPSSGHAVPLRSFLQENAYDDEYATDNDGDDDAADEQTPFTPNIKQKSRVKAGARTGMSDMNNWNDIPDDIFTPRSKSAMGRSSGAATPSRTGTPGLGGDGNSGRKRSSPGVN